MSAAHVADSEYSNPLSSKRTRAIGLAGVLLMWSFTAGIDRPWRRHPVARAAVGSGLAWMAGAPLGLRSTGRRSGLRTGASAAGIVAVAVFVTTALSPVRSAMSARTLPPRTGYWLGIDIPLGTVWAEETAFRGALGVVAAEAFGPAGGRLLQSATFGLTHIPDAAGAGEPIVGTVLATSLAGWVFGLLGERTGSLLAPMLAHLAINEAGAIAALAVQRRSGERDRGPVDG